MVHSKNKTDDNVPEKPDKEKTITVTVMGNDGKEEIVVVSQNSGDLWVCVDDAIESVPDDFLIRSDFGGPEMLVNKKKLTNRLKNANIQTGDIILIR